MLKNSALDNSTVTHFWVCMIEGRILVSHRGVCAWKNKCGAARTFMESDYWIEYINKFKSEAKHSEKVKLQRRVYEQLLKDGIVKYIEISPIPDKCC